MAVMDHLARRVYTLRCAQGMTQRTLADAAGCSYATISNLETGKRSNITLDFLVALARVFETSTDDLLGVTDEETHPSRHTDVYWYMGKGGLL